jgi:MGT family glycosyltransferase
VATIGILHAGLLGHVGPATRLGAVLAERGHRIVAWAPEAFHGELEKAGVSVRPLGQVAEGEPNEDMHLGAAGMAAEVAATAGDVIERLFEERVDVVVHDCLVPAGRVAGEWLGLPRVCSIPVFPPYAPRPPGRAGPGPPADPAPGLAEWIEHSRTVVGRAWGVELGGAGRMHWNLGDANIVYTTPEVAGAEPLDDSWHLVGPLLGPPPDAAEEPLLPPDTGRPLVYMSLGTFFSNRPAVYRAALDGLAEADVDLFVSTGGRLAPEELEPLPDNATVTLRAHGRAALARAAVSITHGGISSVQEALAGGVPMVCLPQGGDQWAWAARIAELGVGEVVTEVTPGSVRKAVLRLLDDEGPRARALKMAEHLQGFDGETVAAEAVEALLA